MTAFVANTNVLELQGLKNNITGAFINDATVTVTIKDADGVEVGIDSPAWPIAMDYVSASDGIYRAIISDDVEFVAKQKYTAFVDANAGVNLIGHWEFVFKPLTRT